MEYRERREPLCLSDLLLVYHDFLLALSRRTERLIQDFNAFFCVSMGGGWPPVVINGQTRKSAYVCPIKNPPERVNRLLLCNLRFQASEPHQIHPLHQEVMPPCTQK